MTDQERITMLESQRDELAGCVREVFDGFTRGDFVDMTDVRSIYKLTTLLTRCQAALVRCGVDARLKDKLAAERCGQEAQA